MLTGGTVISLILLTGFTHTYTLKDKYSLECDNKIQTCEMLWSVVRFSKREKEYIFLIEHNKNRFQWGFNTATVYGRLSSWHMSTERVLTGDSGHETQGPQHPEGSEGLDVEAPALLHVHAR